MYSPLQEIIYNGCSFAMKRDDMIDPFISGNKARKLKYILQQAKIEAKTHLVTFGGAYSNHLVATAAAAARNNLQATGFVRGEVVSNEMLTLCKLFGMRLVFVSRHNYLDKTGLYAQYFGNDSSAFFIDEGGAGALAAKGCAELIEELPADIDHIFCAAGTGTTAAGLLNGLAAANHKARLHIVPAIKGGEGLRAAIGELSLIEQYELHAGYHFGGYAKTKPELIDFIKDFTARTGVLLDPVYTGKMMYALNDLHEKGVLDANSKVVAIHTGGLLGLWGMKSFFS